MKRLQRVYAGLPRDLKSSQCASHYDQSLSYLETAHSFVAGTVVHSCALLTCRVSPRAMYILF